jgi:ATP-dependent DNA helicase HFM1/MER3
VLIEGTMIELGKLPARASMQQILVAICKAEDFDTRFSQGDKMILNEINKLQDIRYPVKGRITELYQRVYLLLQCALGLVKPTQHKTALMVSETTRMLPIASRVAFAAIDHFQAHQDGIGLENALHMLQCFQASGWHDGRPPEIVLQQLEHIGTMYAKTLVQNTICTLDQLIAADPRRLEYLLKRNAPFGNQLIDAAKQLPEFGMDVVQFHDVSKVDEIELHVNMVVKNGDKCKKRYRSSMFYASFVAYLNDGTLLDFRRLPVVKLGQQGKRFVIKAKITAAAKDIRCVLLCENIIGRDLVHQVTAAVDESMLPNAPMPKLQALKQFAYNPTSTHNGIGDLICN